MTRRNPRSSPPVEVMRDAAPIVPRDSVTGRTLVMVVAIMTFVASLTVGTIGMVREAVTHWHTDLMREVTIQVRPVQGADITAEIDKAVAAARRTPGVLAAHALSREDTGKLLEPWLGSGLELDALPLPRLIVMQLDERAEIDLADLRRRLADEVAGASLDDHRSWSARLTAVSNSILLGGTVILALVLIATVLSVSFATRGAVATNRAIVEVLHLVGARDSFIAGVFQRHFLAVGFKGGLIGGAAAALLFALTGIVPNLLPWIPGTGDTALLTGRLALDRFGYAGIAAVVILVAAITALASRMTVRRTLREID